MNDPPNGRPTHGEPEPRCHALQLIISYPVNATMTAVTGLKQERGASIPFYKARPCAAVLLASMTRFVWPIRFSLLQVGKSVEQSDATSHIPPRHASCSGRRRSRCRRQVDRTTCPLPGDVFGPVRMFEFLMLCGYRPTSTYRTEPAPSAISPRRRAVCFRLDGHDSGTRGGCKRGFTRRRF